MPTENIVTSNFVKTYSDKDYIYTSTVLHKGVVIAFAMDKDSRIYYTVLNLKDNTIASSLDVKFWQDNPKLLRFSNEIAQVGFGIADQAVLPVVKKGSLDPVDSTIRVGEKEQDLFLSSTARFTERVPFQVLSDEQYVYLFRQAIDKNHANMIFVDQVTGKLLVRSQTNDGTTSKSGNPVTPIVNATLLVDRFVLVGTELKSKMEVRFQRSRSKTRPQSRKDSLGAKDMEETPFYEPTQELAFVNHLVGGRFAALLLPTQVMGIQRWQIFAQNNLTGLIDTYNVERADDGLFNTRGSKVYTCPDHPDVYELKGGNCNQPSLKDETQVCNKALVVIPQNTGCAESALKFERTTQVDLARDLVLGKAFTQEAWLKPIAHSGNTASASTEQLLIGSAESTTAKAPPSVWIVNGTKLRIGFGDGTRLQDFVTDAVLTDGEWNHIAISFDSTQGHQVYVNGARVQSNAVLVSKQPDTTGNTKGIRWFGSQANGFTGILDEVRIWDRSRTQAEIQADMRQRLTGQEPGLVGYWRFDEASGNKVYDQTNNLRHGTHFRNGEQTGGTWVTSDAPIGEGSGINRSSFRVAGRSVISGLSALMYFQQEESDEQAGNGADAGTGGTGGKKGKGKTNPDAASRPLKRSARVMLAVATQPDDTNPLKPEDAKITTLDFGVSALGRLAQVPDVLNLPGIEPPRINNKSINEQLEAQESLEAQLLSTTSEIARLDQEIKYLDLVLSAINEELKDGGSAETAKGKIDQAIAIRPNDDDLQALATLKTQIDTHATARTNKSTKGWQYTELVKRVTRSTVSLYENTASNWNESQRDWVGARWSSWVSQYNASTDTYSMSVNAADLKKAGVDKSIKSISIQYHPDSWGVSPLPQPSQSIEVIVYEKDNQDGSGKSVRFTADNTDFRTQDPKVDFVIASVLIKEKDSHRESRRAAKTAADTADTELTTAVGKLDKKPWQDRRDNKDELRQQRQKSETDLKDTLTKLRSQLLSGTSASMPLIYTDPSGLSIAGGILNFAWTTEAPLLFESAIGKLALYFRGSDDQFFVTYYRTLTQRARYSLTDATGNVCLIGFARSTERELDQLTITISGEDSERCTVTIALNVNDPVSGTTKTTVTETWSQVPRKPEDFAKVLNGQAMERRFVGSGVATLKDGAIDKVQLVGGADGGLRRQLSKGQTLLLGNVPLTVREDVAKGEREILVDPGSVNIPTETLPLFWIDYNYAAHAKTTALPSDLSAGSRLVYMVTQGSQFCANQTSTSEETLSCEWVAAAPGNVLAFDGKTTRAQLPNPTSDRLDRLAAPGDLTLEAWVRPTQSQGRSRLIAQKSASSHYTLALLKQDLLSALTLNGTTDFINLSTDSINRGVKLGNQFTQECWIYPTPTNDNLRGIVGGSGANSTSPPSIWITGKTKIRVGLGDGQTFVSKTTKEVLTLNRWNHLAVTFSAGSYSLYINGIQYEEDGNKTWKVTERGGQATPLADSPIQSIGRAADTYFPGRIDEVRLWKRARSQGEILADMNKRLGGNETDLIGYWHFDDRKVDDYSRYQRPAQIFGNPELAAGPLAAYKTCVQVGEKALQTASTFPAGSWNHIAAVFNQSYALRFNGSKSGLDCGSDPTLEINRDLTIEVFLQVDDLSQQCSLVSKGEPIETLFANLSSRLLNESQSKKLPYALLLDPTGKLVFLYIDSQGNIGSYQSTSTLTPRRFYRVAVTRKYNTEVSEQKDAQGNVTGVTVKQWMDVTFYIDKQAAGSFKTNNAADAVSDQRSLTIGTGSPAVSAFKGTISEVRLWNTARPAANIGANLNGDETGLVSWWQFEENQGNLARDTKSNNHAKLEGGVDWVKTPDPIASKIVLCHNGVEVSTEPLQNFALTQPQFTLGAAVNYNGEPQELFQGELEEVRIWRTARTPEQLQDNLFRRVLGEQEDLIAYYTFDAETGNQVSDRSFQGNHLTLGTRTAVDSNTGTYNYSTAPIGDDTPLARSALAGVRTNFHGLIQSRVGVQEYGDLQYNADGTMFGVLKRCYAFIQGGKWQLLTGFKVGNLVCEWLGQVQTDPQLIGYIEGAPPTPSENLTSKGYIIGEAEDYTGGTSVKLTQAKSTTYTYSSSEEKTFDMAVAVNARFGFKSESDVGWMAMTEVEDSEVLVGVKTNIDFSQGWLNEASTGSGLTTTQSSTMALRGYIENAEDVLFPEFGRRFVPDNTGFALVQSETADVFALRLEQNRSLICYQMRPNPDIPKDWNILTFPINPRYTKQGTLDGKVGFNPDPDYPQALSYSPDSSYFKPIEAYALKNRIQREAEELQAKYDAYNAGFVGQSGVSLSLPNFTKRNLVNTYVWTADGGLFAETQETLDTVQQSTGGSYSFSQMAGLSVSSGFAFAKVAVALELEALFGGSQNLTVNKSRESETSFGLEVELENVEDAIFARDEKGKLVMDRSDPQRPKPKRMAGKVDAYRFMSFYLEPRVDHHNLFYSKIIDPIWLEQSDDPNAVALRSARQDDKRPPCWRILHRVTYVSRVLPEYSKIPPSSLEKTMKELDIDSNYELIKTLEPFVSGKTSNFAEFSQEAQKAIALYLPELQPHQDVIVQWLCLYFGVVDELALPDSDLELPGFGSNQPPNVNAGLNVTVGIESPVELRGQVDDDRYAPEDLFLTWSKVSGEGDAIFDKPHALNPTVRFTHKGSYVLRLTAEDGFLKGSDSVAIIVNQRPQISAGADQRTKLKGTVQLTGSILDDGLGDGKGTLSVRWTVINGPSLATLANDVTFESDRALRTTVTFKRIGRYDLKLTVSNGTYINSDTITIDVAGRIGGKDLLALYPFEEGSGQHIRDIAGTLSGLDLVVQNEAAVKWTSGGLTLTQPTLITSAPSQAALVNAIQATNEMTLEVWLEPAEPRSHRLMRIVTLSSGVALRNFTLGQAANTYQLGIRTTETNDNASDQVLAAGTVTPGQLTHVVCTRTASGLTNFYINGVRVGSRQISGSFAGWDPTFTLAVGGEVNNAADGHGRDWLGSIHLLALYCRALTADEVQQNFEFGANANLPPIVSVSDDRTLVILPSPIVLKGQVYDDRQSTTPVTTTWSVVGETTNVRITNPAAIETTATCDRAGIYRFQLTASDGQNTASREITVIVNQAPQFVIDPVPAVKLPGVATLKATPISSGLGDPQQQVEVIYQWKKLSGPGEVTFTHATALSTDVHFSESGVYRFQLKADNGSAIATQDVTVVVHQKPTVRGAEYLLVTLPNSGLLKGELVNSGSGNDQAVTAQWEQLSGDFPAAIADSTALETAVTFPQSGSYTFRLTVHNGQMEAIHDVTVEANAAPVIDAGEDREITLPQTVVLDGLVSDDGLPNPPGKVTLQWSHIAGGTGQVHFTHPTSDYTEAVFSAKGRYQIQFSANDGDATATDTLAVVVHSAPVIRLTAPPLITLPAGAVLTGQVIDDGLGDRARGTLTYHWEQVAGPAIAQLEVDTQSPVASVRFPQEAGGWYTFTLTVANGFASTTETVTVLANVAPVVTVGLDRVVNLFDTTYLEGDVRDDLLPQETTVEWTQVSPAHLPVRFGDARSLTTSVTFPDIGVYGLRLTGDDGAATASDELTVLVNKPPVIEASAPPLINLPGSVTLTGRVLEEGRGDPQQGSITVNWRQTSGAGSAVIEPVDSLNPTVTFPHSGEYTFELTVSNGFLSTSAQVVVVANAAPVVNVGSDRTITLPQAVILDALVNDDGFPNPPSQVVLQWSHVGGAAGHVHFTQSNANYTEATFSAKGRYRIALTADDSSAVGQDELDIVVNTAPIIQLIAPPLVTLPTNAVLTGQILDDGRGDPTLGDLTYFWEPGQGAELDLLTDTTTDSTLPTASVTFTKGGRYTFQLTVSNGFASTTATVTVLANVAPIVAAGSDQVVNLLDIVYLQGSVRDDLLPQETMVEWTQVSPAHLPVRFGDARSPETFVVFPNIGVYVLRLTGADGAATASDELTVLVNKPPVIEVSAPPLINLPDPVTLTGRVLEEGRGDPQQGTITVNWRQTSGAGPATIEDANSLISTVTFPHSGEYTFELTVSNGFLSTSAQVVVVANATPVVDAGADQQINLPGTARLSGSVQDDGLPRSPGNISVIWSKVSGPGTVTFETQALETTASFSESGIYTLRLTATDGAIASYDDITVIANQPPIVTAGVDQKVNQKTVTLSGTVTDDQLPPVPGTVTTEWSVVRGPGTVVFSQPHDVVTQATFSKAGTYILRLTANDGAAIAHDDVTLKVNFRVANDLIALYTFDEGDGLVIQDRSEVGEPMNLFIAEGDRTKVRWLSSGGLTVLPTTPVTAAASISTEGAATKVIQAVKASNQITVEVWYRPAADRPIYLRDNPIRILSISAPANEAHTNRNFTLQQGQWKTDRANFYHARILTSSVDTSNEEGLQTEAVIHPENATGFKVNHVVYTWDGNGTGCLYVDGVVKKKERFTTPKNGWGNTFARWNDNYALALARDPLGNWPGRGTFYLVAIYKRVLTAEEVIQNYEASL